MLAPDETAQHGAVTKVASVAKRSSFGRRLRRGQRGWPASFPLLQFPNAPLAVALAALLIAAVTDGSVHAYARGAFYAALAAWAWEELAGGVNWVRRGLGAGGLVFVVLRIGIALGG
jgi:hypothetical protein